MSVHREYEARPPKTFSYSLDAPKTWQVIRSGRCSLFNSSTTPVWPISPSLHNPAMSQQTTNCLWGSTWQTTKLAWGLFGCLDGLNWNQFPGVACLSGPWIGKWDPKPIYNVKCWPMLIHGLRSGNWFRMLIISRRILSHSLLKRPVPPHIPVLSFSLEDPQFSKVMLTQRSQWNEIPRSLAWLTGFCVDST